MDSKKYRARNEKMRSSLDSGNYQSAQREAGGFIGDLLSDAIDGIGNLFQSRREAKERERERQEQLRREREAAERRRKIIKTFFIIIAVTCMGTICFFLIRNIFLKKSSVTVEKTTDIIKTEPVFIETAEPEITETKDIDFAESEDADKSIFKVIWDILSKKTIEIKLFLVDELFQKIKNIPQSDNLLYTVGYSCIAFWLAFAGVFLLSFFGRIIVALFGGRNWGRAGNSISSSLILITADVILYYAFKGTLESHITGISLDNIVTIISFGLFVFANITIIVMLRVKNRKAKLGTIIKMTIALVVIYIPLVFLRGNS